MKTTDSEEFLPTRQSLLERLKNLEDQASWQTFFDRYWRLIYSVARKSGLSDAEAQDVVQETIISVSKKIQGFAYDPAYGSFKGWLKRLTQWRMTDYLRKKQYQSHGKRMPKEEPMSTSLVEHVEDPAGPDIEKAWDEEWENSLLETALAAVKQRVSPKQYQIFYFHACKKLPARQVAEHLGVKLSEVYLARYKVSALVKKEIKALEEWSG
jgi:RNA polymerase sigma factor (sigma-70 family)